MSLGVVKLVFNSNYTVSVYKDGQYLYNEPQWSCKWQETAFTLGAKLENGVLHIYRDGREMAAVSDWRNVPAVRDVVVQWKKPQELPEPSVAAFVIDYDGFDPLNEPNAARGVRLTYRGGEDKAAVPYAIRADLRGSLVYFVNATSNYQNKYVIGTDGKKYVRASWAQTLYVYYLGQYFGPRFDQFVKERLTPDRLTAYDAIYAVTYHEPLSEGSGGGSASQPDAVCVPRKEYGDPVDANVTSLSINGETARGAFSVTLPVREYGCGQDKEYKETKTIDTFYTKTEGLGITDDQGNTCVGNNIKVEGRKISCNTGNS
jgi:hypothetical protein